MLQIMLAEDNSGDVILVQEALQEHAIIHELHVVRDGAEALAFIAHMGVLGYAPCPDLLLLDINLPKVDGPQILREFRSHPKCAHTPVIVVTSSDSPKDRARVAELGISRYFKKPLDFDEFLRLGAVVSEVIDEVEHP